MNHDKRAEEDALLEACLAASGSFVSKLLARWVESARVETVDSAYRILRERLQRGNGWRYGPSRVRRLLRKYRRIADFIDADGMKIIDLGCGPHNPLGVGVACYLNGARESISVDLRRIADPERSAVALYDLLADYLVMPELWHWGYVDSAEMMRRAHSFGREALQRGRLMKGLAGVPCRHVVGDAWRDERGVDAIVSQSVLEHVGDLDELLEAMSQVLRPGGVMLHRIDMRDHRRRMWGDEGIGRWYFLTSDDSHSRTHCNRVRVSGFDDAFARHGFEVIDFGSREVVPPANLRRMLLPQFANLNERDLHTVWAQYILRRR